MKSQLAYLYLLSPLHTGGTSQEGNVVGIARETHTNFPYIPSSTIRGRYRADVTINVDTSDSDALTEAKIKRIKLFGPDLDDLKNNSFREDYEVLTDRKLTQLEQGSIWIGDGSLLWLPVASLSHGVVWISCPLLLQRWSKLSQGKASINVPEYSSSIEGDDVYLKDAILPKNELKKWSKWEDFLPPGDHTEIVNKVIVLPNQHCETLIQMSLWRQVKVKLSEHKVVTDGSFRYEEAIPPDTLMYFPWGITAQANGKTQEHYQDFRQLLEDNSLLQIGGQESLGRGFVEQWLANNNKE
ncbi:MAG: type III-B CRISPR module RAMP protein Cmr4 [Spirulinaceae cyanobacterium]